MLIAIIALAVAQGVSMLVLAILWRSLCIGPAPKDKPEAEGKPA